MIEDYFEDDTVDINDIFPCKISNGVEDSGVWYYEWVEQSFSNDIGAYEDAPGGRSGDTTDGPFMVSVNSADPEYTDRTVWARLRGIVDGDVYYEFSTSQGGFILTVRTSDLTTNIIPVSIIELVKANGLRLLGTTPLAQIVVDSASASQPGTVSTSTQTFVGEKRFQSGLVAGYSGSTGSYIRFESPTPSSGVGNAMILCDGGADTSLYLIAERSSTGGGGVTRLNILGGSANPSCAIVSANSTYTVYYDATYAVVDSAGTTHQGSYASVSGLTFKGGLLVGGTLTITVGSGGTGQTSYTKGDILVATGSTTLAKVAVGSNGQVLTADSGQTAGVKWDTPTATVADADYGSISVSGSGTVWSIDAGAVGSTELASGAVTTAKIAAGAVDTAALGTNSVTTGKITDANVTLAKIANAAANSKLVGSGASGSGASYSEITLGSGLSMSGTTLNASGAPSDGDKGDISVSSSGTVWTVDNTAITLAKIQNASANSKLLGSGASGSGASYSELTLGTNLSMSGTTLNASASVADGDKGDITVSSSGATWTIDNNVVTYAKMQDVSNQTKLLGRGNTVPTGGDVEEIDLGLGIRMDGTTLSANIPVGSYLLHASATPPNGYLLCDGSAVSRTTYAGLFAVVGTAFGVGNGSTTFNLPDCRDRQLLGFKSGTNTLASTGGAKTVTLTSTELPSHNHTVGGSGFYPTAIAACNQGTSGLSGNVIQTTGTALTSSTGSGSAFSVMNPWIVAGSWHIYSGV